MIVFLWKNLMNFLNGQPYVEVKYHRSWIHHAESIILRLQDTPKSLITQNQLQIETQIRKNQKVAENNGELEVKTHPKNKGPIIQQQPNFKPPNCPSCKRKNWLEIDKGYYCQNYQNNLYKQKHQIDKKSSKAKSLFLN